MDVPVKRKVTAKLDHNAYSRVRPLSRPGSPTKQLPKAKVNGGRDTLRKLSSSSSLTVAKSNHVSSRPGSPFKSLRPSPANGSTSPVPHLKHPNSPRPGIKSASAQVTSQGTPESRQRSLTSASPVLGILPPDDRPRSGSVGFPSPKLPASGQASPVSERAVLHDHRLTPALPPTKIKSKVSNLAKLASSNDVSSSSSSSPSATTRPVTRPRAPSLTSGISLNTPSSSPPTNTIFYPITTAAPAANPYRYNVSRHVQSPVRNQQAFAHTQDTPPKKLPLFPKIDPTSVPLPPHSPPISTLSLSSKSSQISETNVSLEGNTSTTTVGSHGRARSVDWRGAASPFATHLDTAFPSTPVGVRKHESDVESVDEPERHLRAEAKTNRKIADLEITNRSLLAINASLETTKNRQAKEIRDLRRRLRESRLILPPRTYDAVKSSFPNDRDDELDDDDDADSEDIEGVEDEGFERVKCLLDALIQSGKRALESKPEEFRNNSAKVLNADEVRWWQDSERSIASATIRTDSMHNEGGDDQTTRSRLSPAPVTVPGSDCESSLESVEGSPLHSISTMSPLPPITITHP
ncbi:hypothetical protein EDC04DRAFT_3135587 [Pisolithus marmoratus]|nr:hypothetical protein EDC04DRAFT_3135587 [Pisolithus marmoratus]